MGEHLQLDYIKWVKCNVNVFGLTWIIYTILNKQKNVVEKICLRCIVEFTWWTRFVEELCITYIHQYVFVSRLKLALFQTKKLFCLFFKGGMWLQKWGWGNGAIFCSLPKQIEILSWAVLKYMFSFSLSFLSPSPHLSVSSSLIELFFSFFCQLLLQQCDLISCFLKQHICARLNVEMVLCKTTKLQAQWPGNLTRNWALLHGQTIPSEPPGTSWSFGKEPSSRPPDLATSHAIGHSSSGT